jgi:hypothetical protein
MKAWVLQGTVDGANWTQLDSRENNTDFPNDRQFYCASFQTARTVECRFIRLWQTAKNHYPDHQFVIHSIEFFGSVVE